MRISDWSSDVCSSDLGTFDEGNGEDAMSRKRSRAMADLTAEDAAREAAALWCIRLSENDMSTEEWSEFDGWLAPPGHADLLDRKRVVWGQGVAVRVDLGGRRNIK